MSRLRLLATLLLSATAAAVAACDDESESMTTACRAQKDRFNLSTGSRTYSCSCHEVDLDSGEDPGAACRQLYDELEANSNGGSSNNMFAFVVAAPGLGCDEITVDPCDNTDI